MRGKMIMTVNAPWLKSYDGVPHNLEYPNYSMVQQLFTSVEKYPDMAAYSFFGCKKTFREFRAEIESCARGFLGCGIKKADRVTICMPNTPQAIISIYALNLMGAVANMVHPLSAEEELVSYINDSESVAVLTLDQFVQKLETKLGNFNSFFLC